MIGKMNRLITLNEWASVKDAGGGISKSTNPATTFKVWARVENRSGFIQTDRNQRQWPYDYKVTVWHDARINEKLTITYDGKDLQINSLQIIDEGNKKQMILRCSSI